MNHSTSLSKCLCSLKRQASYVICTGICDQGRSIHDVPATLGAPKSQNYGCVSIRSKVNPCEHTHIHSLCWEVMILSIQPNAKTERALKICISLKVFYSRIHHNLSQCDVHQVLMSNSTLGTSQQALHCSFSEEADVSWHWHWVRA